MNSLELGRFMLKKGEALEDSVLAPIRDVTTMRAESGEW